MKSKLLIPALSFASIGAMVAPIATSCKSNQQSEQKQEFEFQFVKDSKVVDYKTQITPATKQTFTDYQDIDLLYVSSVTKNPQIFADDYLISTNYVIKDQKSTIQSICKSLTLTVSNVKIEHVSEAISAQRWWNMLSFDLNVDIVPKNTKVYSNINVTFSYKDLPLYFYDYDSSYKTWYTSSVYFYNSDDESKIIFYNWYSTISRYYWMDKYLPTLDVSIKTLDKDGKLDSDFDINMQANTLWNPDAEEGSAEYELYTRYKANINSKRTFLQDFFAKIECPLLSQFMIEFYIDSSYLTNIKYKKS